MQFYLTLFTLSFFYLSSYCQEKSSKSPHYALSDFAEGIILMKDGTKQMGVINYNALSGNFALKIDDKILAVAKDDISKIDTVYVANRKFFRKEGTFLELLLKSNVEIYLEHKCNLESSTAASSGYGGTSQTTSGTSISSIENEGNLYDLELPENYKIKPFKMYWIIKNDTLTKIKTLGQLKKLYKERKKDIKTYRKTNNVDFSIPLSIVKLLNHLES